MAGGCHKYSLPIRMNGSQLGRAVEREARQDFYLVIYGVGKGHTVKNTKTVMKKASIFPRWVALK